MANFIFIKLIISFIILNLVTFTINTVQSEEQVIQCRNLYIDFLDCKYNTSCTYGGKTTGNCTVKNETVCIGERTFEVEEAPCYYCYQLPQQTYFCNQTTNCKTTSQTREVVNCRVHQYLHCLGSRNFSKSVKCNWTSGYRWSTTFILSVTLGGFGVDRFYLGYLGGGLGKLFSFGGLGVWTLIDIVLIGVGYIKPYDGSMYIY